MASLVKKLVKREVIPRGDYPLWLPDNIHFETHMGSLAYGCANDDSDVDVYGFCIPQKDIVFPHLAGHVYGFEDKPPKKFDVWVNHHIEDQDAGKQYDIQIFNIVKYFKLCAGCNPNMIDSLFVPDNVIIYQTPIFHRVRSERHLFLSKKAWHTFKGYAYSQLHKMKNLGSANKEIQEIREFEDEHNIDHSTTFEEVEKEMKKRGLLVVE